MSEFVYAVDGPIVRPTRYAAGPWDPRLQHGGAPSALAAWAAEKVGTPVPMRLARLTVELLRPVPVAELTIETDVLRQGRKIQLVQVRLFAGGVEVTRATALKVRAVDMPLPGDVGMPMRPAPLPESVPASDMGISAAENFASNFELRRIAGGFADLGPGRVWFRQHRPLVEGMATSPAMRATAVADFSNGISAVLPFSDWTFLNGDLTVSLAREPEGDWIFSDAETWAGPDGIGTAVARLADRRGPFGHAIQTLILEQR